MKNFIDTVAKFCILDTFKILLNAILDILTELWIMEMVKILESPKWDLGGLFLSLTKEVGLKAGDEIAFLVNKGVDNSFAYRMAWDVRGNGFSMYIVPGEKVENSRRIEMLEFLSLQAGQKATPKDAKLVILCYGVHKMDKEKVKKTIGRVSKDAKVMALNLVPKSFEKSGWGESLRINYYMDVEVDGTETFDLTNDRSMIKSYPGFNLMKAFNDLVTAQKLKKGDEVLFIPGYGVCTVFAYRFAWELRDSGFKLYVTPGGKPEETRPIEEIEDIGMQAAVDRSMNKGASLVVLLTGLIKTFPYPDKVKETVAAVAGPNCVVIAENIWVRAFEDGGWDKIIGISATIDVKVTATKVYKVE
jgi:hypothetical protein